jgi:protein-tyrosine phosphatase
MPGRSGDLEGDVGIIAGWGAVLVLSMTLAGEMAAKGAGNLRQALAVRDIAWRGFPIMDYGAPTDGEGAWPGLSADIAAVLDAGGAVLLHCAGGKGRSGMVAARVLAERGLLPGVAIAAVRQVRPGAIETPGQEAWAAAGANRLPGHGGCA